ncbi:MAG TPA: cyclic nucleotide-binding domain-containing protein [Methylomirabilota bacterium]|jgi:CRP/FNR family cyclic AMP-dependent transcriptional regulator|nr:cyclic nucleotide-binding domain-containing protein [Methylomirabilota bacterium]
MLGRVPDWLGWMRDAEHARRVGILARTAVFAGLPRRLLARLAVQLFEKSYAPAELVFAEGDPGKGLFVVLDGEVEIVRETLQGPQRIVTFGPGTAFGELALIDDLPRSATARATAPTRLLILYRTHFEQLVAGDRSVALLVMRNLLRLLAGYVRAASVPRPKPEAVAGSAPDGEAATAVR